MVTLNDSCSLINSHAQMLLFSFYNGLELCKTLTLDELCKGHKRTLWMSLALFKKYKSIPNYNVYQDNNKAKHNGPGLNPGATASQNAQKLQ